MSATIELLLKNEKLLSGIQARQKTLHSLSQYLSELESQLALIFASSPDIIAFLDKEANIIKISDAAYTILGYKREELTKKSLWNYICEKDLEQTKQYFKDLNDGKIDTNNRRSLITHWVNKKGNRVKLLWRFSICDEKEQKSIGIASDVTELGFNNKHSLKLLQRAVELSTDGIFITDEKFNIIYCNESFTKITGYEDTEAIGNNFLFMQADEHKNLKSNLKMSLCLESNKSCEIISQDRKKDGTSFLNRIVMSPVVENEVLINYIGVIRDVSEEDTETESFNITKTTES